MALTEEEKANVQAMVDQANAHVSKLIAILKRMVSVMTPSTDTHPGWEDIFQDDIDATPAVITDEDYHSLLIAKAQAEALTVAQALVTLFTP